MIPSANDYGFRWVASVIDSLMLIVSLAQSSTRTTAAKEPKRDPYAYSCDSKAFMLEDFGNANAFVESPERQKRVVLAVSFSIPTI